MSLRDKLVGEMDDRELESALKHFKASVDAWSDAAYSRPRTTVRVARHGWRLATGWALGCVVVAGSLTSTLYVCHHQHELAKIAVQKAAQKIAQKQPAAEPSAASNARQEDQDLLATVDSDISRQVPAAMEPLAQMMDDNGSK
jgi:hypothetical protein